MTRDGNGSPPPAGAGDGLLPIGEFARRSRLPASTLRYYDELGVLRPARVDPVTGYRFYDPTQLPTATLVVEMRRLGISPEVIGEVVAAPATAGVTTRLRRERRRVEAELRERAAALADLDRLIAGLAAPADGVVERRDRPAMPVVAVRGDVRSERAAVDLRRLMVQVRTRTRSEGQPDPSWYGAVFPLDLPDDPVVATVFGAPASGAEPAADATTLPAMACATVERVGDDTLASTYDSLLTWIAAQGCAAEGPVVEEYLGDRRAPRTRISVGLGS